MCYDILHVYLVTFVHSQSSVNTDDFSVKEQIGLHAMWTGLTWTQPFHFLPIPKASVVFPPATSSPPPWRDEPNCAVRQVARTHGTRLREGINRLI